MVPCTNIHEYLQRHLPKRNTSVLEIGAGEGTIALGRMFDHVSAIESDPQYFDLTARVQYIYVPLVPYEDSYFRDATFWYDRSRILDLPRYDAIIIDGPKGSLGRGGFFTNLELFKANTYIFDDTHRLWEFRLAGKVAGHFGVPFQTYTDGDRWFSVVETRRKIR